MTLFEYADLLESWGCSSLCGSDHDATCYGEIAIQIRELAKEQIPEIARVSKANLQPNDVIVIECEQNLSVKTCQRIEQYVEQVWPGRKVVVLEGGLRMRAVGEDAALVAEGK